MVITTCLIIASCEDSYEKSLRNKKKLLEKNRATLTKIRVTNIYQALKKYKADNGMYPTAKQGLKALMIKPVTEPVPKNWKEKYMHDLLPVDGWRRKLRYRNPGIHNDVDIYSLGADVKSSHDDIGNW